MKHPGLGALVASHSEDVDFDLPHFITIGFPSLAEGPWGGSMTLFLFVIRPGLLKTYTLHDQSIANG